MVARDVLLRGMCLGRLRTAGGWWRRCGVGRDGTGCDVVVVNHAGAGAWCSSGGVTLRVPLGGVESAPAVGPY